MVSTVLLVSGVPAVDTHQVADFEAVSDGQVITNLEALPSYGEREISESGQIWANWILETSSQVS